MDALGDGAIDVELDVTSAEQWDAAVAHVVDRFGSLTTLINNAGVLHRASLSDETPDGLREELAVQLSRAVPGHPGGHWTT